VIRQFRCTARRVLVTPRDQRLRRSHWSQVTPIGCGEPKDGCGAASPSVSPGSQPPSPRSSSCDQIVRDGVCPSAEGDPSGPLPDWIWRPRVASSWPRSAMGDSPQAVVCAMRPSRGGQSRRPAMGDRHRRGWSSATIRVPSGIWTGLDNSRSRWVLISRGSARIRCPTQRPTPGPGRHPDTPGGRGADRGAW